MGFINFVKTSEMKKQVLYIAALLISVFVLWKFVFKSKNNPSDSDKVAFVLNNHNSESNLSFSMLMDGYYELSEAFVNWDTAAINESATTFIVLLDRLNLQDFKTDSILFKEVKNKANILKDETLGMTLDENIDEKRASFNLLSQQTLELLKLAKYSAAQIYYQECPMALNQYEISAFWLSKNHEMENRRNPYLGLYDKKYGKGMLRCGQTIDSVISY